jgi:hypothetical protein
MPYGVWPTSTKPVVLQSITGGFVLSLRRCSGVIFQWGSQLAVFKIVISWLLEMLDRCERVSTAILNAYHHLVSHTKCCLESLQIIPVLLKDS